MTVVLPAPLPLEPLDWASAEVEALARHVSGAAQWLFSVEGALSGSAARAPHWQGADARAAAGEVAAVASLSRGIGDALDVAHQRLRGHAALLSECEHALRVLRREQAEDFAAAWGRLRALTEPAAAMRSEDPQALVVVDEVVAAEASRRRRHSRLREEAGADARRTAAVLVQTSAVVGAAGRRGDEVRVVAHLAARLPGWGELELAARGRELAREYGGLLLPGERQERARRVLELADDPAFAAGFLVELGEHGVRDLLRLLGEESPPPGDALSTLLATTIVAAGRSGLVAGQLGTVLEARYVAPDEAGSAADAVVLGMGAVLAAGLSGAGPALPIPTVISWGRQMLDRERVTAPSNWGPRALDRVGGPFVHGTPTDPVLLVARTLTRAASPAAAAEFLGETGVWDQLLARPWDDPARKGFTDLIARAAEEPGAGGQGAVRAGLTALGAGLEDHDPGGWTVDRATAAAIAPTMGVAVVAQLPVALDALSIAVGGVPALERTAVLRGMGLVVLDQGAAAGIEAALHGWSRGELAAGRVSIDPALPTPAVAVPSAFLAVQEYGFRLDHALDGFEARTRAENQALAWDLTVGMAGYLPGVVGTVAGMLEGGLAIALGVDGTWELAPDGAPALDRYDAVSTALARLEPADADAAAAASQQAGVAFDRVAAALGDPLPPESPGTDWLGLATDGITGLLETELPFRRWLRPGGGP